MWAYHQDIAAGAGTRIVEFSVFAEAGGLRIVVDVDATAVFRTSAKALTGWLTALDPAGDYWRALSR